MTLAHYFFGIGFCSLWMLITFFLALNFDKNQFFAKTFFISLFGGMMFSFVWTFLGICLAIMGAISD